MSDLNYLVIDIETIPNQNITEECQPVFDESSVKLGNLQDRFKIAAKIEEARTAWSAKLSKIMSTDPDLCQIVVVAGFDGSDVQAKFARTSTEEHYALSQAWGMIYLAMKDGIPIVSFNGKAFDFPVMLRRSMLLDVPVPPGIYDHLIPRYDTATHIDMMSTLAFRSPFSGKPDTHSLAYYLKMFGLPGKTTGWDGSMVYPAFQEGRYDDILAYAKDDVRIEGALFERVALFPPISDLLSQNKAYRHDLAETQQAA